MDSSGQVAQGDGDVLASRLRHGSAILSGRHAQMLESATQKHRSAREFNPDSPASVKGPTQQLFVTSGDVHRMGN